jgi:hypothetical protein
VQGFVCGRDGDAAFICHDDLQQSRIGVALAAQPTRSPGRKYLPESTISLSSVPLLFDFLDACTDHLVAHVFPRTVSRLNFLQHLRFSRYCTDIGYAILNELRGYDSVGPRNRPQVPDGSRCFQK